MNGVTIDPAKLDEVFAAIDGTDRPGVVVGVAHLRVPRYRRGFGLASVELPVALSPSTRIRIGSVTKHFCCMCVMLLAERGLLSVDDSVRRHIPELKAWAADVTLSALMSHTSGARCSLELFSVAGSIMSRPLAYAEQLKVMLELDSANFAPGSDWSYSNGGYVLLTEVVRRVSGRSFEEFLTTEVLTPAGMHDTVARPDDNELLPNSATLHVPTGDGTYRRGVFGPEIGGEGSMVSTVDDMLRWMAQWDAPVVGSAETWRAMTTPVALLDDSSSDYGYGLATGRYRGQRTIQHSGTVVGGACQMIRLPELQLDVIVIANATGLNPSALAERVVDVCVVGLPEVPADAAGTLPIGDFYSADTGHYVRLAERDGKSGIEYTPAFLPFKMQADGSGWYQPNLTRGATIAAADSSILLNEFGPERRLPRALPPIDGQTAEIAGSYRSPEIDLSARIDGERMTLSGLAQPSHFTLEARAPGLWMLFAEATGAVAAMIERDGRDLLLSSLRIRRLRLGRCEG